MRISLTRIVAPALVLALAPVALSAQQPTPPQQEIPAEAQPLIQEMQQLQAELQPVEQQALQDEALQAEQAALAQQIQAAMADTDPSVAEKTERLQALMAEAQQAESQERGAEIVAEAQQIQASLQEAQQKAIELPEVSQSVEQFQSKLKSKMTEIDPASGEKLARLEELNTQLAAILGDGA